MAEAAFDLVVRSGTIADGSGREPFEADVAIAGGRIVEVGTVRGRGRDEIDARGRLVTPGFVDIHTHYDGQVTWEHTLAPSSDHGVTTVVMSNCGVGFAPCKPEHHDLLLRLMEGIEDIPLAVMAEGIPWAWESFPEYLDHLEGRACDVDFAVQVPHAPVRVYVMGQRAADREPASAVEIRRMAELVAEAVDAGALGFTTSRTMNHRTRAGALAPTVTAAEEELRGIARGLRALGKGVLQAVDDFHLTGEDDSVEFSMWRRIAEESGRPFSFSLFQTSVDPQAWRYLLALVERANADGVAMRGQVSGRPVGSLFGLELSTHPFLRTATYESIADLPLAERVAQMRRPEIRERLLAEAPAALATLRFRDYGQMFPFGDPPDYSPPPERRIDRLAARNGVTPLELAYDVMLEHDGRGLLYGPTANFADGNLDPSLAMMQHPDTIIGLGDGGAHVARICDASLPTHLLTYWTRDRAGDRLPLAKAIRMLTHDTAAALGLHDRGMLAPGLIGDVNVIDYDHLQLAQPQLVTDLPAGGGRLKQRARGYAATIKSGVVTYRDGTATGALPGRLVRGAR
jgi:N-acyl-D-amino-acid deacylase